MQDLVFDDMRRWLDAGIEIGHVAINASAAEFRGGDFAERVLERLRAADIPPRYLELEVTETVFLGRGAEHVGHALRTLSAEGVKIALDDFGTGFASLSHLKQFPVDIIKIDRSFVQDLANNPDDAAILQAVLSLGINLGITTVAEGIETHIQAAYLRTQGCDLGQGYLFGKAVPRSEVPGVVSSWDPGKTFP
jgi:EAL domain-containing protein (putative c-di-GMP-specific phosphodiesterase class I)